MGAHDPKTGPSDTALADTVAASGESAIAPTPSPGSESDLARGATLGRYIVLDRLGQGGMGVVYAAYDPELDRKVALKLLRATDDGADVSEGRARLLREAQAIARVAHPNVIAVHDVGMIGDQVFVAMELVEGDTLTAWLLATARPVDEILALFAQAGRGLAAAHAKGLVHRDFKPDNVLVGKDGRVRVLDFGLAYAERARSEPPPFAPSGATRITDLAAPRAASMAPAPPSSGSLETSITRTGAFMGTPLFMSPEQFGARRTDARTDQFSFCVSLYDALYGAHPFDVGDDPDIPRLSRAVMAGKRRVEPAGKRVPAAVRAAIDRGLCVDPTARFASMADLLDALRPQAPRGRARILGAVALVLAAIAVVASLRAFQSKPLAMCGAGKEQLAGVWDDAKRGEAERAFLATGKPYAASAFASASRSLDDYATAWAKMHEEACAATHVRGEQSDELLDLRMQCLGERRAELRALGDLFTHADTDIVERAAGAAQSLSGIDACANTAALKAPMKQPADPAKRAAIAALRERLAKARALEGAGKYNDWLAEAEGATIEAQRIDFAPLDAEASLVLGRAKQRAQDFKGAHAALVDAIASASASRHDAVVAEAWIEIVLAEGRLHDFARADDSARYGEAAIERLGRTDDLVARLASARGDVAWWRGHFDEALAHHRAALAIQEKRFGAEDIRIAAPLRWVAHDLTTLGKYDEAIALLVRALAITEQALGPDHPEVGQACVSLSNVHQYAGQADTAVAFAQRGLAVGERALGPDHPQVASALLNLGNAYDDVGNFEGTFEAYRRALAIREKALGPDDPLVADVIGNLAEVMLERRRWGDALAYAERALAIREKTKGPKHVDIASALTTIGRALCALGKCKEAIAKHERALAINEAAFGAEHPDVADVLLALGTDRLALRDAAAAVPLLDRAHALHEKLDVSDRERAESGFALARALWDSGGDRTRARDLADKARAAFVAGGSRTHDSLGDLEAWSRTHANEIVRR